MEQVQKDIKEVLSSPAYYPALEAERSNGLQLLQNRLVALEKDLEVAYDNAPTDISPLVNEEMDADEDQEQAETDHPVTCNMHMPGRIRASYRERNRRRGGYEP